MSEQPSLAVIQSLFFRAITWPSGVRDFLERADPQTRLEFQRVFAESASFDAVARVDVYANAYFYRLLGALRELFPRLARLCGEVRFHNLITDYVLACPSSSPDLRRAGDRLPGFVAAHELAQWLPLLADVARTELAMSHALDCPDGPRLTEAELARCPAERWPGLRFELAAPTRRIDVSWDIATVLERCDRGERDPALGIEKEREPIGVLVGRRGHGVYARRLSALDSAVLAGIEQGRDFGAICSSLPGAGLESAPEVVSCLRRCMADGALGRVISDPS